MPLDTSGINPGHNYGNLLSADPPIVLGWTGRLFRFGSASAIAPVFKHRRIVFLLIAKGSVADATDAREQADDARPFMRAHPHHRFEWICNIGAETELLRGLGLSAHTHNQNLFLRDEVFVPLRRVPRQFDAIYNARISPEKRNDLAAAIPSVAFIAYRDPGEQTIEAFHTACAELNRRVPGGRLLNALNDTGCARLSPSEVNCAYAAADVGLCLSPREGAMRVAVEYQMAGLPIVATPCRGGRDYYLDPETWIVVPPDPRAVRDAVAAMQARAIPRQAVRARVTERIERERSRFIGFIENLLEEEGRPTSFARPFRRMLRNDAFERWMSMRALASEVWEAVGGDAPPSGSTR
jgi:glycosyltransferase involved in cell wall biosynthesis